MAEKLYYSMGEVSEMFDVKPSLVRYWCKCFSVLKPKRNNKGNRLFTPEDIEHLKVIYHLVKERGMTLEGAEKALKAKRAADANISVEAQLLERLQHVRAMLVQVRDLVSTDGEVQSIDDDSEPVVAEQTPVTTEPEREEPKPEAKAETESESAPQRPLPFYEQTLF